LVIHFLDEKPTIFRLSDALRLAEQSKQQLEAAQTNERRRVADLSATVRQLQIENKELSRRLDDNNEAIRVAHQQIDEKHQQCTRYGQPNCLFMIIWKNCSTWDGYVRFHWGYSTEICAMCCLVRMELLTYVILALHLDCPKLYVWQSSALLKSS
jgi:hypothetical protein